MTREAEPNPKAALQGTSRIANLATRATGRMKRWFRRPNEEHQQGKHQQDKQWTRALHIRSEVRSRERARIARELHGTLLPGFLGASMQLHRAVEQLSEDAPGRPALVRALDRLEQAVDHSRDTLQALLLSGIRGMNLEEALSAVRDEFAPKHGEKLRILVQGQPTALQPAIQEQIYRIAREALVNALRHSGATLIEAEIEYLPRWLRVVVRDNGRGFHRQGVNSGRAGYEGLAGMRERAENIGAQLRMWSRPGAGTEVEILVHTATGAHA